MTQRIQDPEFGLRDCHRRLRIESEGTVTTQEIKKFTVVPFAKINNEGNKETDLDPLAVTHSQNHTFILYNDCLIVTNKLNKNIIAIIKLICFFMSFTPPFKNIFYYPTPYIRVLFERTYAGPTLVLKSFNTLSLSLSFLKMLSIISNIFGSCITFAAL